MAAESLGAALAMGMRIPGNVPPFDPPPPDAHRRGARSTIPSASATLALHVLPLTDPPPASGLRWSGVILHGVDDALALLERLGTPPCLVRHHELVVEAANELVADLHLFASYFDVRPVLLGAALHDIGRSCTPTR